MKIEDIVSFLKKTDQTSRPTSLEEHPSVGGDRSCSESDGHGDNSFVHACVKWTRMCKSLILTFLKFWGN